MPRSSRRIAGERGAASARPENAALWKLSKREILEAALHLAALATASYDAALTNGGAKARLEEELAALRANGII